MQVGAFDVRDPLLTDVWGVLEDAGTPVVLHAGSGPVGTSYTGPGPVADLLRSHPRLALVIAHLGAPEYAEFVALAETYERVRVDTTMVFTDFFDDLGAAFPADLVPRLRDLQPKVLLGSDFPNIPYAYGEQLAGLERLDLGDDWLRAVCWDNAAALFGDSAGNGNRLRGVRPRRLDTSPLVELVETTATTTQEGLIGFDLGRQFQGKRVEKPTSSRKRSSGTYNCQQHAQ